MTDLIVNGEKILTDQFGYLVHSVDWHEGIAIKIAESEALSLTEDYWFVIYFFRNYYQQYHKTPSIRILVNQFKSYWYAIYFFLCILCNNYKKMHKKNFNYIFFIWFLMNQLIEQLIHQLIIQLDSEKGSSIYLNNLFPKGILKQASKLAGLPRPTRCM